MLKKNYLLALFLVFSPSWGKEKPEKSEKSAYRYIIDNYFSKRDSSTLSSHYTRSLSIYSGLSFYRESSVKLFPSFSSVVFGFNQQIKEIQGFGDVNIQFSFNSLQLERQRAVLLEVMPQFSFPEMRSTFPIYMGLGAGLGFYPRNIIRKKLSLSLSGEFFLGLRFLNLYHNLGFSSEVNLRIHTPFNELEVYLESLVRVALVFCF